MKLNYVLLINKFIIFNLFNIKIENLFFFINDKLISEINSDCISIIN